MKRFLPLLLAILFTWTTAPASELVTGYRLLLGAKPGVYAETVDVGNVSAVTLDIDTRRYRYAAVVAYNATGSSSPSAAVALFSPKRPRAPKACEL